MSLEAILTLLTIITMVVAPFVYLLGRGGGHGELPGAGLPMQSDMDRADVDDDFNPNRNLDPFDYELERIEETRQRQLQQDVRDILRSGDESTRRMLSDAWGSELPVYDESYYDEELVREIARKVKENTIRILAAASKTTDQFELIELRTTEERQAVPYLADEVEYDRLGPGADFSTVDPTELALPPDVFNALLVGEELHAFNNIQRIRMMARGYLLVDVSGSMREEMSNGTTRIQWAAGVGLRLMFRALDGNAQFVLRYYGDEPFEPYIVTDLLSANGVANQLLSLNDKGCGTNIMAALEQAYRDITEPSDFENIKTSDVVLISDGESALDIKRLKEMFGEKSSIRLHVALIGKENPVLKEVAVSYTVY